MVLDLPPARARSAALTSRGVRALKELPPRRPEPPAPEDSAVRWDRVDVDRYEVRAHGATLGFIDVVGAVFVVLAGARYDRAVEVLQTLDFATAVGSIRPPEMIDRAASDTSPA